EDAVQMDRQLARRPIDLRTQLRPAERCDRRITFRQTIAFNTRELRKMKKCYLVLAVILLVSMESRAGQRAVQSTADLQVVDGWGRPVQSVPFDKNPGPVPVHDLSGMWEPAGGPGAGIQANGPVSMPSDGIHEPPFTPAGKASYDSHKALFGYRNVPPSLSNDPRNHCDPLGFPRDDFYQLRHTEILQNPNKTVILYQYDKRYRT